MTTQVSFEVSAFEARLIQKIASRAAKIAKANGIRFDMLTTVMNLTACHANGCQLDLNKLLAAPDGDFGHDVFGICRYLDRDTSQLTDFFVPRCALPETTTGDPVAVDFEGHAF